MALLNAFTRFVLLNSISCVSVPTAGVIFTVARAVPAGPGTGAPSQLAATWKRVYTCGRAEVLASPPVLNSFSVTFVAASFAVSPDKSKVM